MVITNEVMYVFMLQLRGNIAINLLSIVQIDQPGVCSIRVF